MPFSARLSEQRVARVAEVFDTKVVRRILCFALYLLGANRARLSEALGMPPGSVRSLLRMLHNDGLPALEDRRRTSSFLPRADPPPAALRLSQTEESVVVELGHPQQCLVLPRQNRLQVRAVLLSLLHSGLLTRTDVAEVLELTPGHTQTLAKELYQGGLTVLLDRRQGQQTDYRFTPAVKAELIQQFVLDLVVEGKATGAQLSQHLQERCQLALSERSIRDHVNKLGLNRLCESLPDLLAATKKNSASSSAL